MFRTKYIKGGIDMTQGDKELLVKDLCARFPYGVRLHIPSFSDISQLLQQISDFETLTINDYEISIDNVKPYLRPMSSMTEEEKEELKQEHIKDEKLYTECIAKATNGDDSMRGKVILHFAADWCDKNHFDYRGLIPKGLAIAVTKENNPYKV